MLRKLIRIMGNIKPGESRGEEISDLRGTGGLPLYVTDLVESSRSFGVGADLRVCPCPE